jgi:hypothetical protein
VRLLAPLLAVTLALAAAPAASAAPTLGGCPIFPDSAVANHGTYADWNRDVSRLPVHPSSSAYVASIGAGDHLHPDFGSNPAYGIPFVVVPATQRRLPVSFTAYGDESNPGPYPIPPAAPVEAGGDRHVLALQRGSCRLYELFGAAYDRRRGRWTAASGAVFDLRRGQRRPEGWTSADAAGLPILPGLVRYGEVAAGRIDHAVRFTVSRTQRAYLHPATHFASSSRDPRLPPMGLRLRLKAGYPISRFPPQSRIVLTALKRYGMIVADNGSDWFITGARSPRWNDADLGRLKTVPGSAFEVVNTRAVLRRR